MVRALRGVKREKTHTVLHFKLEHGAPGMRVLQK